MVRSRRFLKITSRLFGPQFSSNKLVKILNILERNIQDSVKLSTLMSHVSYQPDIRYRMYDIYDVILWK